MSALREFRGSLHASADQCENLEFNGGFERRGALKTVQRIEDQQGIRFISDRCRALCSRRALSLNLLA